MPSEFSAFAVSWQQTIPGTTLFKQPLRLTKAITSGTSLTLGGRSSTRTRSTGDEISLHSANASDHSTLTVNALVGSRELIKGHQVNLIRTAELRNRLDALGPIRGNLNAVNLAV